MGSQEARGSPEAALRGMKTEGRGALSIPQDGRVAPHKRWKQESGAAESKGSLPFLP